MRRAALLPLVLVLVVLGGCGGDRNAKSGCDKFGGGTTAQKSTSAPSQTMLLTAVGFDSDGCKDRVTFDFRDANGAEPGYLVEYRPADEAQTEDASGNHIPIDGNAFLVVRFEPSATADMSGANLERTYIGPRNIHPDGTQWVQQISKTGDFEAVLTWAIGLSEQREFKVTSEPSRLTIELG